MSQSAVKQQSGFTLFELIMTMAIIMILTASSSVLAFGLIQHSIYLPNKLNIEGLANDAIEFVMNGDENAGGLRYSRAITLSSPDRIDYTDQDGNSIGIRLRITEDQVQRQIFTGPNTSGWTTYPSYTDELGIDLYQVNGRVFTYYDAGGNTTTTPANVRRVQMTFAGRNGTGTFADWQGDTVIATSVAVRRLD